MNWVCPSYVNSQMFAAVFVARKHLMGSALHDIVSFDPRWNPAARSRSTSTLKDASGYRWLTYSRRHVTAPTHVLSRSDTCDIMQWKETVMSWQLHIRRHGSTCALAKIHSLDPDAGRRKEHITLAGAIAWKNTEA